MRITNSMIMNNYLSDLSGNLNRLSKYQQQESTGKAINNISDDPVAVAKSLLARNRLSSTERYKENVSKADSWLTEAESGLSQLNDVIQSAYESSVKASSGTLNEDDLNAISEEIGQLRDEIISTANAKFGSNFLFGGYNTTGTSGGEPPFKVDSKGDLYYNGINMSNEASVDYINESADAAAKALTTATDANTEAQGASLSSRNSIIASVTDVADYVEGISEAAEQAAKSAKDISDSADLSTTTMGGLLSGLSDYATEAASAAKDAANAAFGTSNTAQAAATAEEDAYTAWQEAIGTDGETDAHNAYLTAQSAADTAISAARASSADAISKANDAKSAIDTVKSSISASAELTDLYFAISGWTAIGDTASAINGGNDAITALQTLSDAANSCGNTALKATIDSQKTNLQTAIDSGVAANIKTEMDNLSTSIDGYRALSIESDTLDNESNDAITLQIGAGLAMEVSPPGTELLGRGSENVFVIMDELYSALKSGADQTQINDYIGRLQNAQSRVLSLDAKVGAKAQHLDTLSERYEGNVTNYTQMKSDAEDVDLAEAIMHYKTSEKVYSAALAAGSQVIQTSLIDFLR